ncbi:uncharacterized protein LOC122040619 [Zingiber officinale]|uniref:Uncharacterized protein n=1 Tax=Zingiber officinale TaxID=94328 RepID=A0A8J5LIX8_ZINOF|nr:uncharacterized protein LOC122040619 [Zingiber officinale]KAG6527116.1 hypothetical protein ZIOFF_009209 [Zingiber officinale]
MKRKTPSELRSEQLKQRNGQIITEKLVPTLLDPESNEIRKGEQLKIQKYFNTRVNEIYPVKKSSERCKVLYGDAKAKEFSSVDGYPNVIPNPSDPSLPAEGKTSILCENVTMLNKPEGANKTCIEKNYQGFRKIDRCSQNMLRNVVELHMGDENLDIPAKIDMEKALKELDARNIPTNSTSVPVDSGKIDNQSPNSSAFCSEFEMPGPRITSEFEIPSPRIPFDFTLKTSLRLVLSSSVKWCHRSFATPSIDASCNPYSLWSTTVDGATPQVKFYKSLHSWVYPQSSLPASVVSVLASSAGKDDSHFWLKRQQDWEDSFRSLYYMLRKNICNMFYVYTVQFVVLFIGGNLLGKKKRSCNAYISQSTHGLRSLLRKNKISFTMPFGEVEVDRSTEDDLVELMEIEKKRLGQIFHPKSTTGEVDNNTSRSLLSFSGHEEVQSLYDILINYRETLNSFTGSDVPVLYASVPFQNATLHVPEMTCKEIRKGDMVVPSSSGSDASYTETIPGISVGDLCFSVELKDAIIPPWVVYGVWSVMSSEGTTFQSFLKTEPTSLALNVALKSICSQKEVPDGNAFGLPAAVMNPSLRGAILERLSFSDGVYTANITSILDD